VCVTDAQPLFNPKHTKQLYVIRWVSCVIFQILPKFSSGAFQDGGKNVNYFVASIPASFGQNFHFSTHKMAENQHKNI